MNNGHDQEHIRRHERTERLLAALADRQEKTDDELRVLLKSQVLMGENLDKLATHVEKIDIRLEEVTAKFDALIDIVDHHARDDQRHK